MKALNTAFDLLGGPSKFAAAMGISVQRATNWLSRRVPAEMCPKIERLTGGKVLCESLRPDVDWGELRGTSAKKVRRHA